MPKNLSTFPVMKNGAFFGYADADQIARNPALTLYDERKAQAVEAEKKVEAAKAEEQKKTASVERAKSTGSDPSAVKKG